jgi:hypothetical protein
MKKLKFLLIGFVVIALIGFSGCISNVTETEFEDVGILVVLPLGEGTGNSVGDCFTSDLNEIFIFNHKKGADGNYLWSYSIEPNNELRKYFGQEVFIKGKIVETQLSENESCIKLVVDKIDWVVK